MSELSGESPIPRPWVAAMLWIGGILLLVPMGRPFYALGARALGDWGFAFSLRAAGIAFTLLLLRHAAPRLSRVPLPRRILAFACLAAYAATIGRMSIPEELAHPLAYLPLGLLLDRALVTGRTPTAAWLAATAIAGAAGVLDEALQALMPGRFFDAGDVALDMLSASVPILFLRLTSPPAGAAEDGPPLPG